MLVDTRIDRDIRPIFVNDLSFGRIIDPDPLVNKDWTGDNIGGERRPSPLSH